jgi:hypothetical protein
MSSWFSNITDTLLERARSRSGMTDPRSQFGGRPIIDHRAQMAQEQADRARYADRYRAAHREYRKAMGYDDDTDDEDPAQ